MENPLNGMPGYRVYEYKLVLNPHEELRKKIVQVKQHFYDTYKAADSLYSQPYITLVSFMQYELFEERISNRLKAIAMGYPPTKIELKDFGSFPSHSIYINVVSKLPVQGLVKRVRTEAQRLMKLDAEHKPHFLLEPHVAIARKLLPWQYEQGWLEYSNRHFTGRFIADGMLLLKRAVGEMKYQVVQRYEFQNLPVTTTQGDLFG